jgi:hypothetical protein
MAAGRSMHSELYGRHAGRLAKPTMIKHELTERTMTNTNATRRDALTVVFGAGLGVAGLVATTSTAAAYQGNMERALNQLFGALASLRRAVPNKGGHRERAIELVQQAIGEVQAGIDFAAPNGG